MRITSVNIPKEELTGTGLQPITMTKLSQFVVLAGKNGSGKTRILNSIKSTLKNKPTIPILEGAKHEIQSLEAQINFFNSQLQFAEKDSSKDIEQSIEMNLNNIAAYKEKLSWSLIETSALSKDYTPVFFVPRELNLINPYNLSGSDLEASAIATNQIGIANIHKTALAQIQFVQNLWFNSTHSLLPVNEKQREAAIKMYERLKNIIEIFLGTELSRRSDGQATLFGFPLGEAFLSEGQKILIQLCIAIYSQGIKLKDVIVMLDEPENHLHPSAVIQIIDRFRESIPDGQIWIATHSVPLLAHFNPADVWYVENGKVEFGGVIPEKVLNSLLGDEESIDKIKDFLSLPAEFASTRYAYESLFAPNAVLTDKNDPQSLQIAKAFEHFLKERKTMRILDYGAGKGRILANVFDYNSSYTEDFKQKIDYIAFDEYDADKPICIETITKVYGTSDKRYFNSIDSLLSTYDKGSFDILIMCNVLHEIDPNKWLELFGPSGRITQLISKEGFLLLVEDNQIPHGEKPYQNGFLVLTTPAVKDLFKITEADTNFIIKDEREGRLKCHYIPGACLQRADMSSRQTALQTISVKAKEEIEKVRKEKAPTYKHGKQHGFWVQQFANAQLSLSQLAGS